MLVRIVNFLIGALLGAGGGYLVWTERGRAGPLFPPGPEGQPWMLILGIAASIAGVVFIAAAVIPRPKRAARLAEAAAERKATLGAAESYYSDPARAAAVDSDWRSGDLPPQPKSAPAAAPAHAPALPPELGVPATAKPVAVKPVATSYPPAGQVVTPFPSTATLAPIPVSAPVMGEAPPPAPAPLPHHAPGNGSAPAVAPPAGHTPAATFDAIRAALAAGHLDEADKLLTAERDKAQGEALAELTGLAGDHAAAAGRQSNAKWLWRLALKRFGECNAMSSPAARAVSERLRLADN